MSWVRNESHRTLDDLHQLRIVLSKLCEELLRIFNRLSDFVLENKKREFLDSELELELAFDFSEPRPLACAPDKRSFAVTLFFNLHGNLLDLLENRQI